MTVQVTASDGSLTTSTTFRVNVAAPTAAAYKLNADFNGDGRQDIATLGSDGEPVWLSNGVANNPALNGPIPFCWWFHDAGCDGAASVNSFAKRVFVDVSGKPALKSSVLVAKSADSGPLCSCSPKTMPLVMGSVPLQSPV